jgi:L-lactate dehydrogenase complex protein LldG
MSSRSREEILHNVRKGLSGINRPSSIIANDRDFAKEAREIRANLEETKINLTEQFTAEVENVNTTVINVKNSEQILQSLVRLCKEKGVRSFAIWETPHLKDMKLKERLKEEGLKVVTVKNKNRLANVDIGITEVDYAIADTGTLALLTDKERPRGVSLLPPIHLAIVRPDNLVSNIRELFILLKNRINCSRDIKSCMTFITGPSRTADIELNLTLGVHGPKELFVLIS